MPFAPGEDRPYPGRGMWGEGALSIGVEGRSLVLVVIRGEGTRCVLPRASGWPPSWRLRRLHCSFAGLFGGLCQARAATPASPGQLVPRSARSGSYAWLSLDYEPIKCF